MSDIKFISGGVTAPEGFTANGIHCGIRKNKSKRDLALIFSDTVCDAAAVYTQNIVKGAPIAVTCANLRDGKARAVICNSGIANTCNADGEEKAQAMCEVTSSALHIGVTDVIVASTGVIGQPLSIEPIANGMEELVKGLSRNGGSDAAEAIMTTDTRKKEYAVEFQLGGKTCRIGAIAKGSGMIHPNMATMLSFLTTDAAIASNLLNKALHEVVDVTYNMISIDGDTSTNDMVSIMASGRAGNAYIETENEDYRTFVAALRAICQTVAREIARDGEGATHLMECRVKGANTEQTARQVAKAVICSSLVKAAIFGADANWGRVLCAMGYSGADINVHRADVAFVSKAGSITVCKNGAGVAFSEEKAKEILLEEEILIDVTLYEGDGEALAYGCDLTYDYVKINGDYRT